MGEGSYHARGLLLREIACGFESACNLNVFFVGAVAWLDIVQIVGKMV